MTGCRSSSATFARQVPPPKKHLFLSLRTVISWNVPVCARASTPKRPPEPCCFLLARSCCHRLSDGSLAEARECEMCRWRVFAHADVGYSNAKESADCLLSLSEGRRQPRSLDGGGWCGTSLLRLLPFEAEPDVHPSTNIRQARSRISTTDPPSLGISDLDKHALASTPSLLPRVLSG